MSPGIVLPAKATRFCVFFRRRTGDPLSISTELSVTTAIELDLDGKGGGFAAPPLLRKYGRFRVLVLNGISFRKLLGSALPASDGHGIYWFHRDHIWWAFRRYRGGTVLDWFSAPARGQVDARWFRLDRVMRDWPG